MDLCDIREPYVEPPAGPNAPRDKKVSIPKNVITVLRVEGKVGEGLQTKYGEFIKPGPWRPGRVFGQFKSWPNATADLRLGNGIYARLEPLSYIYLGRMANSLTLHTAERTAGVHYGTAAFSVDKAASGEYFRIHTPVAKLTGSEFDVVIEAGRVEPTQIRILRGRATLTHRHYLDSEPVVLRAGQCATIRLDQPDLDVEAIPAKEMAQMRTKLRGMRDSTARGAGKN